LRSTISTTGFNCTSNCSPQTDVRELSAFVRLARLPFLFGGFAAFALGAMVARYDHWAFGLGTYLWGQLLVTSFHLMVHFANDYFDQESDALTARTAWSGGSGVLAANELPPRVALIAALACAGMGTIAIVHALVRGNVTLALIGVGIAVLAWCYSAPPVRLLARGLGELDTIAVVALLVPLAGYATFARAVDTHALVATIPGICAMFAMMISVEIPDAAADTATGKRNLVVRWGAGYAIIVAKTFAMFAVLLLFLVMSAAFAPPALAYAVILAPAAIAFAYANPHFIAHIAWATIPFLGVMLFGITTCAAIALVVLAAT
jgi:1,4-dihydroxy-2-naphthoate octaprenyltransferase